MRAFWISLRITTDGLAPFNSTMSLKKVKATGFVIPKWQEALQEFYKQDVKK